MNVGPGILSGMGMSSDYSIWRQLFRISMKQLLLYFSYWAVVMWGCIVLESEWPVLFFPGLLLNILFHCGGEQVQRSSIRGGIIGPILIILYCIISIFIPSQLPIEAILLLSILVGTIGATLYGSLTLYVTSKGSLWGQIIFVLSLTEIPILIYLLFIPQID